MPKYLTITEARKNLPNLTSGLISKPIIITKHGWFAMVIVSYEHMESLLETFEILEDEEFASQLATSIEQDRNGDTINWKDAQAKLGW